MSTNFMVHVRVRPLIERELQNQDLSCITLQENTVLLRERTGNPVFDEFASSYSFTFDKVFAESSTHEEVYQDVEPLLDSFLSGYNAAILCYGLTSSGKTYTLSGILDACIGHIISRLAPGALLTLSYLQIYNEQLDDLLADSAPLRIRESANELYVEGLAQFGISSAADAVSLVESGNQRRHTASTVYNALSSRSHTVLTLELERRADSADNKLIKSKIRFVDLAGSERLSNLEKQMMRETQNINRSLNALGKVIYALTEAKRPHVPYRDSILTRLLSDSIGGDCRACMIVCLSPASSAVSETLGSLRFAERAKRVKQSAAVCYVESNEGLAFKLEKQLEALRAELQALKSGEKPRNVTDSPVNEARRKLRRFSIQDQISALEFKLQHGGNLTSDGIMDEITRRQAQIAQFYASANCIPSFQQVLKRQTETLIHLVQRIGDKQAQIDELQREKAAMLRYEAFVERRHEIFAMATAVSNAPQSQRKNAAEASEEVPQNDIPAENEAALHAYERYICLLEAQIYAENDFVAEARDYTQNQAKVREIVRAQLNSGKNGRDALRKYFYEQKALIQLIKNKFAVLLNKVLAGDKKGVESIKTLCKQTIQAMEVSQAEYEP